MDFASAPAPCSRTRRPGRASSDAEEQWCTPIASLVPVASTEDLISLTEAAKAAKATIDAPVQVLAHCASQTAHRQRRSSSKNGDMVPGSPMGPTLGTLATGSYGPSRRNRRSGARAPPQTPARPLSDQISLVVDVR